MFENAAGTILHKRLIIIALLLCVLFSVQATLWGVADIVVKQPRYLMQQWEQGTRDKTTDDWQEAVDAMHLAIRLNPYSPEYNFDLGRLYEWRALEKPLWTEHARDFRAQAIEHYRKAVQQRPVWALAWIHLAMSKTINRELDDEAKAALEHAATYGRWEYGVHKKIIWLGLATWNFLPTTTQQKIIEVIEQSLIDNRDTRYIKNTAEHFNWQDNLNSLIEKQKLKLGKLR